MKVVVENFLENSHSKISWERGQSENLVAESVGWLFSLGSAIRLWVSSSRPRRSGDPPTLGSLSDYRCLVVLEGIDLSLEC